MSEDPTTPQESNPTPPEGQQTPPEQTIEVNAQFVPEAAQAVSAQAKTGQSSSEKVSSSTPSAGPAQSQDTLEKLSQQAQQFWTKAQPVLKEKSIQALLVANRFTNHFLDNIWPKLSKQAIAAVPDSAKAKIDTQIAKAQPTLDKIQPFWKKFVVPNWQNVVVPNWNKLLGWIRQKLPDPLQKDLTNRFMTIVILALTYWVYSFFSSFGGHSAVAKQPAVPKPVATPLAQRPMRSIQTQPLPTQPSPQTAPVIKPSPSPRPIAVASPKPSPVSPPVSSSPAAPSPVVIESPKPSPIAVESPKPSPVVAVSPKPSPVAIETPKPSPLVTPPVVAPPVVVAPVTAPPVVTAPAVNVPAAIDLAAVQTQLNSAIAGSGESLISSVQTSNANNRLQVSLGNDWYGLSDSAQTQVAQTLLERSQTLKFGKLELRDDSGELVARSPLIGTDVIILKR